jgi:hypothetical protein
MLERFEMPEFRSGLRVLPHVDQPFNGWGNHFELHPQLRCCFNLHHSTSVLYDLVIYTVYLVFWEVNNWTQLETFQLLKIMLQVYENLQVTGTLSLAGSG